MTDNTDQQQDSIFYVNPSASLLNRHPEGQDAKHTKNRTSPIRLAQALYTSRAVLTYNIHGSAYPEGGKNWMPILLEFVEIAQLAPR